MSANNMSNNIGKRNSTIVLNVDADSVLRALRLRFPDDDKKEIFDFLDDVASEADSLANIWVEVSKELVNGQIEIDDSKRRAIVEKYSISIGPNAMNFERLMTFTLGFLKLLICVKNLVKRGTGHIRPMRQLKTY